MTECQCEEYLCNECGLPIRRKCDKPKSSAKNINGKFKLNEEKVLSNEVPPYRRKRLFMVQSYISESEGLLTATARDTGFGLTPKKFANSNWQLTGAVDKNLTRPWDQKTNLNQSRRLRSNS